MEPNHQQPLQRYFTLGGVDHEHRPLALGDQGVGVWQPLNQFNLPEHVDQPAPNVVNADNQPNWGQFTNNVVIGPGRTTLHEGLLLVA
jgi:hypothetical protein